MSQHRPSILAGSGATGSPRSTPGVGITALLVALVVALVGLVAMRPAAADPDRASALFQQRVQDVRATYPDAVAVDGRGMIARRGGDDIPALLDAAADRSDARTFSRALELLLESQGQQVGIPRPADPDAAGDGTAAFQQTPTPTPTAGTPAAGTPAEQSDSATEGVGDDGGGSGIPFIGESVVLGDVSGDGLDDVVRWTGDGRGSSAVEAVRGIDGSVLWTVPIGGSESFGVALQPLADTTGDGVPDLLTSLQEFDDDGTEPTCDDMGCSGRDDFTWRVQLRTGTSGAVVWERTFAGSNEYEEAYGPVEYRYSYSSMNAVVPHQPLQDVTGDGVGDFLVILTTESASSEQTVQGAYPGTVTESSRDQGTASTTVQVVSGVDGTVVTEVVGAETDSVLGGRAVPDTTGDGTPDVLLTRRDLSRSERTCITEGTARSCTEEGRQGGVLVQLVEAPSLDARWAVDFPLQEAVASSPGDLTGDGVRDTLVQAYTLIGEGILVVLDGMDGSEVWTSVTGAGNFGGGDGVLTVTPLQDDGALDLLTIRYLQGESGQPSLEVVRRDGATGAELLVTAHGAPVEGQDDQYSYAFASGIGDADADGSDDVLITTERFSDDGEYFLTTTVESGRTGAPLSSLPQQPNQGRFYQVVGDLDGDGGVDAVAFADGYGGVEEGATPPSTTAVRLRDGSVLWTQPAEPNAFTNSALTAQLDGDAGGDLLLTRDRFTEFVYLRQTVAVDGADGQTLWTAPPPPQVRRVAGSNRIATAVALSQATRPAADVVVIARADDFPDALAGGPLAGALDAPLLLTDAAGLSAESLAEIQRLGAAQAVLLGGTAALGEQVATDLAAVGLAVDRLAGADRYETAALVADRVAAATGPLDRVALAWGGQGAAADPVTGEPGGWTDAILASAYGAGTGAPLLLTRPDGLPEATAAALLRLAPEVGTMLVGGAEAINPSTEQQVRDLLGLPTERLAAADPVATSELVAVFALRDGATPRSVWIATSTRFPDALAASAAVGATDGVLLLTDGAATSDELVLLFLGRVAPGVADVSLVGGTTAVTAGTEGVIADALAVD